ncbi:polysaccharide biosynthesis protein [Candidatus Gottesmanbacteria bacterium]|nr:polysaccharide biosynthesis protein [Candidatus Gottesmanbacteria bacterium]
MKKSVREHIKNKTILITGGTGSFGNTVIEKLLSLEPARIVIFSRDEKKQFDMRNYYNSRLLRFIIGDVRDGASVSEAMDGVDFVFHAAALKQVPSCEFFPIEAVKTNVLGTQNVLDSAIAADVSRVVILSTDKAAYPINAMGMTKAIMEKVMVAAARKLSESGNKHTVFCGVRYGNVLYSRGSVLPFFIEQVKKNNTLPVTNPSMTRFLLPLPEAVDLVLYALVNGENGHLYVRKSRACTVGVLVEAVCRIFSHAKGYREVGIRAGEKYHETLLTCEELARVVDRGSYFDIPPESQGLEYNRYFLDGERKLESMKEAYTSENTPRAKVEEVVRILSGLSEIQDELIQIQKK